MQNVLFGTIRPSPSFRFNEKFAEVLNEHQFLAVLFKDGTFKTVVLRQFKLDLGDLE